MGKLKVAVALVTLGVGLYIAYDKAMQTPDPTLTAQDRYIENGYEQVSGIKRTLYVLDDREWKDAAYSGGWYDDEPNGYGKLVNDNGDYYEGQFVSDDINGNGRMKLTTDIGPVVIVGSFSCGRPYGEAQVTYFVKDRGVYAGFDAELNGDLSGEYDCLVYNGDFEPLYTGLLRDGEFRTAQTKISNIRINSEIIDSEGKYIGSLKGGKPDGYGVFWGKDYACWGSWKDGALYGRGRTKAVSSTGVLSYRIGEFSGDITNFDGELRVIRENGTVEIARGRTVDGEWVGDRTHTLCRTDGSMEIKVIKCDEYGIIDSYAEYAKYDRSRNLTEHGKYNINTETYLPEKNYYDIWRETGESDQNKEAEYIWSVAQPVILDFVRDQAIDVLYDKNFFLGLAVDVFLPHFND